MGVIVIAKGVGVIYCAAANADLLGMRAARHGENDWLHPTIAM